MPDGVFVATHRKQEIHKVIQALAQLPNPNSTLQFLCQRDSILEEAKRRIENKVMFVVLVCVLHFVLALLFKEANLHFVFAQNRQELVSYDRISIVVAIERNSQKEMLGSLLFLSS